MEILRRDFDSGLSEESAAEMEEVVAASPFV
jgi:hypothetical protein